MLLAAFLCREASSQGDLVSGPSTLPDDTPILYKGIGGQGRPSDPTRLSRMGPESPDGGSSPEGDPAAGITIR